MQVGAITVGDLEVLTGGTIVVPQDSIISLRPNQTDTYTIELSFVSEGNGTSIDSHVVDNKKLQLKLKNFDNSLGTGNIEPMEVGTHESRTLFLMFVAYMIGTKPNNSRVLHYTFYMGKKVG
jgi:hypothetical protein